jgi:hypothetical protein
LLTEGDGFQVAKVVDNGGNVSSEPSCTNNLADQSFTLSGAGRR